MPSLRTWFRWAFVVPVAISCAALAQPSPTPTPSPPEGDPDSVSAPDDEDGGVTDGGPTVTWRPLVDAAVPVVTGNNVRLTAGELYQRLEQSPPDLLLRYAVNQGSLQDLVDRLVADRLLAAEARRRGLMEDPTVRAALERALVARLRATAINPQAGGGDAVTQDELQAWYDAHPERFHISERRRVRVIFLTNRREAQNVLRLALARRRRQPANDFRELAGQYNTVAALRDARGNLQDITPTPVPETPMIDPALRAAIYSLREDGDVLPQLVPARWENVPGFFIVRRVSRRPAIDRSLAQSAGWIRERVVLERRVALERAFVERLATEARLTTVPINRVVAFDAGVNGDAGPVR